MGAPGTRNVLRQIRLPGSWSGRPVSIAPQLATTPTPSREAERRLAQRLRAPLLGLLAGLLALALAGAGAGAAAAAPCGRRPARAGRRPAPTSLAAQLPRCARRARGAGAPDAPHGAVRRPRRAGRQPSAPRPARAASPTSSPSSRGTSTPSRPRRRPRHGAALRLGSSAVTAARAASPAPGGGAPDAPVAVVDTGVDTDAPRSRRAPPPGPRRARGRLRRDLVGHGTFVAGLISRHRRQRHRRAAASPARPRSSRSGLHDGTGITSADLAAGIVAGR